MYANNESGIHRMFLARGIDANTTLVTPDNWNILITGKGMIAISNLVSNSKQFQRNLSTTEVDALLLYLKGIPASRYANRPIIKAMQDLAAGFIARQIYEPNDLATTTAQEIGGSTHFDGVMEKYQRDELMQMTPSESVYKWTAMADRRGNAVTDWDRTRGDNSAPHNIAPIAPDEVQRVLHNSMKYLGDIIAPKKWDETLNRIREGYSRTFLDIQLARQTVSLDSRNADPVYTTLGEFSWLIHTAGQTGAIGDVRIQDTIQQVVAMRVCDFWVPMLEDSPAAFYKKVRMFIREFQSQSITVAQFPDPTEKTVDISNYHFEFEITEFKNGRAHLEPCLEGRYMFRLPFAQVNRLTLQFRTPFEPLAFDPQYLTMTLTYGVPTVLSVPFPQTHNMVSGDLVYIINSNSGNITIDRLITASSGYIITFINPQSFSIPIDTSILAGSETVRVYCASKRVFLSVEFTSIEQ